MRWRKDKEKVELKTLEEEEETEKKEQENNSEEVNGE